jgi:multidrug resistance efflux pump
VAKLARKGREVRLKIFFALLIGVFLIAVIGIGWSLYIQKFTQSNSFILGSGTIEATELDIGSQIAGKVEKVKVKQGKAVKKGDILVELDDRLLKERVIAAEADVEAAKAELEEAEGGTETEKLVAQAKVKQAEANLAIAKLELSYTKVKSPADGVVLNIAVSRGEVVNPGSTVVTIGKLSPVKLVIYVKEKDLARVNIGDKAVVTVDAFSDREFEGKVSEIASEAEFTPQNVQTKEQRATLVFAVTISLPNQKTLLKPGMPADAKIRVGK